ncbi:hypothetical protein MN032_11025 [Agromyces atrinae]|uniref:hypothetical protein n=1 Tax=Agromyces atrinae TaxID=592376 RepID=UPI001F582729|nr:hypothetical protein [Agromyces atrinae]MCI2958230.1 hypothetical protein [Agromyces atrinae]
MGVRLIRISSRATGERRTVRVYVYTDLAEMRAAASGFRGQDHSDSLGVTHAYVDDDGRVTVPIIRLWVGALSAIIVSHEIAHAALAIFGSTLPKRIATAKHLHNANETHAHLHSDLESSLIRMLYAHGYFE